MNYTKWSQWLLKRAACKGARKWVREHRYGLRQSWENCCQSLWLAWLLKRTEDDAAERARKAVAITYVVANEILGKTEDPHAKVVQGMHVIYCLLSGDRVSLKYLRGLCSDLMAAPYTRLNEWVRTIIAQARDITDCKSRENHQGEHEFTIRNYWGDMFYCAFGDIQGLVREARRLPYNGDGVCKHDDYDVVDLEFAEIIRRNFRCPTADNMRRS